MDILERDITPNAVVQTVADIVMDYVVGNTLLPQIAEEIRVDMRTSAIFHVIDEMVTKMVIGKVTQGVMMLPLAGNWLGEHLVAIMNKAYVQNVIRIIVLVAVQKIVEGDVDVVESVIILLNTMAVDYGAEIRAVHKIIGKSWDDLF